MALFARMDPVAMAAAIAVLLALGLTGATAALLLQGAPPGVPIGTNLSTLGNILPGYSVSWMGSLKGAAWAAVIGAAIGFLIAAFWNFAHFVFMGLAALSYPRHLTHPARPLSETIPLRSDSSDAQVLSAVVRLNVCISAVGVGLGLGLILFVGTNLSLALSQHPGRYLNLLGVFMPGYSASAGGAWIGLLWGAIYGAISGGALAWLYARSLGTRIMAQVVWDAASARQLRPPAFANFQPYSGHWSWSYRGSATCLRYAVACFARHRRRKRPCQIAILLSARLHRHLTRQHPRRTGIVPPGLSVIGAGRRNL